MCNTTNEDITNEQQVEKTNCENLAPRNGIRKIHFSRFYIMWIWLFANFEFNFEFLCRLYS